MRLTIHRGTHQIGGNCIEVESGASRIILDVGMPLMDDEGNSFDSRVLRGKSREELLQSEILPNVPGLFDSDPSPEAILLSHSHLDHTGLLGYTLSEIPVYATKATSQMMLAGRLFANQVELPQERHRELIPGKAATVGPFRVTAYSVDHSVYGAAALLIEAEGKVILYSGDLRLHGRKPGMAEILFKALSEKSVDLLLMEGTHLGGDRTTGPTETELEADIVGYIREAPGLVLASFSPQHLDRFVGFIRATQKTGRIFVVDAYSAFILDIVARSGVHVPEPTELNQIRVYYPLNLRDDYHRRRLGKIYERFFSNQIELTELFEDQSRYLMLFRPSMLRDDFGGKLPGKVCCIYSRWAGYLDQPEWRAIQESVDAASGTFLQVHTSGHIFPDDLAGFVQRVNPKYLVPVHTSRPELFRTVHQAVVELRDREDFTLS